MATKPTGKPRAKARPPRLKPDKRRKDPTALVGVSPSDVVQPMPPFDGQVFSVASTESDGRPKAGRPRKPIDAPLVEKLAAIGIQDAEMADLFGVSPRQFSARKKLDPLFASCLADGRARYKAKIREHLNNHMDAGNFEAVRWMAVQELGHRRNPETKDAPPEVSGKSVLMEALEKLEADIIAGRVVKEQEGAG